MKMTDKTKAALAYFLSALAYAALGVDKLTAVDLSQAISIVAMIVGPIATAFGIGWTNPLNREAK